MPKIEIQEELLYRFLGKSLGANELRELLTVAKAELDERISDEGLLKIELNDTNRPDLWSTAGLARQLKVYSEGDFTDYPFFSRRGESKETEDRIIRVDPGLEETRPYIAAFLAVGVPVDDALLKDLIQSQEKLCWNYGRKRAIIAMGIYRGDRIKYPVHYRAADPDTTAFIPLELDVELTLRQILTDHPKGIEFGSLVASFQRFPYLEDDKGDTLSFPPIINSAYLGAVEVGDDTLFIELTGPDLDTLLLATSISACDFADAGYEILPVRVKYPYDTPYGREVVTPYYFQTQLSIDIKDVHRLLGEEISIDEAVRQMKKLGNNVHIKGDTLILSPSPYRNDFMHPVDAIEEIVIGRGLTTFQPELPEDFTIGRCSKRELFAREVREIMLGLGFQEMIYSYLGSKRDFQAKMNRNCDDFIEIENPMSENYEIVRNSILPNLLASETVSAHALYPHKIFEIGEIAVRDENDNSGSKTKYCLSFLYSDPQSGFNEINSIVSAVFYYVSMDYHLRDTEDSRFIEGRCAAIVCGDTDIGVMGEIHPVVNENWNIEVPCVVAEIDLDLLLQKRASNTNEE